MITYGKKSLADKVKSKLKYFVKRNKMIEINQGIEKYDLRFLYAVPVLSAVGFLIYKYLLVKSNGFYALVPFSFTVFLMNKGIVRFSRKTESKRLDFFRVKNMVAF